MKRTAIVSVLAVMVAAQPAWAMRTRAHELAESPQYKQKVGGMLGRGIINGVTFFVDPLVNIVNETKLGPPVIGTLTGLGKGIGCGALRLGSGVVDIVTFWVPGFNGFPVSDSYENCIVPSNQAANWGSSTQADMGAGYHQAPATTWEVPTAEPGAAQAAAPEPAKPKKVWTK